MKYMFYKVFNVISKYGIACVRPISRKRMSLKMTSIRITLRINNMFRDRNRFVFKGVILTRSVRTRLLRVTMRT